MTRIVLAIIALVALGASAASAATVVRVGGYEFPPFVETVDGSAQGVTRDMIAALNRAQKDYEFRFVPVSPRRRYAELEQSRFDVMLFESPEWEWTARRLPVDFTDVLLTGGEVFITQAGMGRGQDYFDDLKAKRIVGILGYHYGFAGFDADPERLARNWTITLVSSHKSSIDMILAGRADLAVVTDSYLWRYLERNPGVGAKLLVSTRFDQVYNHRALVRRDGPIDVGRLNGLLAGLKADGTLDGLWKRTGVRR